MSGGLLYGISICLFDLLVSLHDVLSPTTRGRGHTELTGQRAGSTVNSVQPKATHFASCSLCLKLNLGWECAT